MAAIKLDGNTNVFVKESIDEVLRKIDMNFNPKCEYIEFTGHLPEYDHEYRLIIMVSKIVSIDSI